jgi:hypothetical protein
MSSRPFLTVALVCGLALDLFSGFDHWVQIDLEKDDHDR